MKNLRERTKSSGIEDAYYYQRDRDLIEKIHQTGVVSGRPNLILIEGGKKSTPTELKPSHGMATKKAA